MITIKNKHDLCFSRALVSAKAFVDQDPQYQTIFKGQGLQGHLAYKLQQETGVAEGMCGLPEIQRMQDHLGPQGYQIKIYEGACGALWYCDPSFDSAPKKTVFAESATAFSRFTKCASPRKQDLLLSPM